MKEQRGAQLHAQRQAFDATRDVLAKTQSEERAKIRQAWQHVYAERGRSFGDRYQKGPTNAAKARQDAAPVQEQKPMKREFDNVRRLDRPQPVARSTPEFVAKPAPAPSPAGDVPKPPARELRDVPAQKKDMPALKRLADAKRDFSPAAAKPAPDIKKDWNAGTADRAQGLKRLPPRDRDRDREPER